MAQTELNDLLPVLIEKAKDLSKEKFLTFAENMYGIDRSRYNHLWQTKIVSKDDLSAIFPLSISTLNDKDIKEFIDNQIGQDDAVFIPHATLLNTLPTEARDEYLTGIQNGTHTQIYNSIILYNMANLQEMFECISSSGKKHSIPQNRINADFVSEVSKIFSHERIHQNARYVPASTSELEIEDNQETSIRQGARLEYSDDFNLKLNFENYDEALTDIMAKIIKIYSPGDSIEDCLQQIILDREHDDPYKDLDDRPVLALFTLFPDELSRWTMLQTFDNTYKNLLLEKYIEVVGGEYSVSPDEILQIASEYLEEVQSETLAPEVLTKRQKILQTLIEEDINLEADSDIADLLSLIFSSTAMEELPGAVQDIKNAQKQLAPPQNKKIHNKNDIEP